MPITEVPNSPAPVQDPESPKDQAKHGSEPDSGLRRNSSDYGDLGTDELVQRINELEDERRAARIREGIWVAVLVHAAVLLLWVFGPRYLWKVPVVVNPTDKLRQQRQLSYLELPPDVLKQIKPKNPAALSDKNRVQSSPHPTIDKKTLEQLQAMKRAGPPTPQPQQQAQQTPQPQHLFDNILFQPKKHKIFWQDGDEYAFLKKIAEYAPYAAGDIIRVKETFWQVGKHVQSHPEDDEWNIWNGWDIYHYNVEGLPTVQAMNDWGVEVGGSGNGRFIPYKGSLYWRKMSSTQMPLEAARLYFKVSGETYVKRVQDFEPSEMRLIGLEIPPLMQEAYNLEALIGPDSMRVEEILFFEYIGESAWNQNDHYWIFPIERISKP